MSTADSPLLARPGAVAFGSATPDHYGDPAGEQRALAAGHAVSEVPVAVVRVAGPDRLTWLHNITSQDLAGLRPRESTETLVLSPHGHIEFAAGVVDDGEATWLLTDATRAAGLTAWLDAMRFTLRVEVADLSAEFAVLGEPVDAEGSAGGPVTWRDPWPAVAPGGTRYGPPDAGHPGSERPWRLVVVPRDEVDDAVTRRERDGARLVGNWAVEAARIAAWRPSIRDADHRTIPHELDWLRTAVHLNKGCYRGQETVARVHNLGRPPRRLTMLHLDGSGHTLPEVGAPVFTSPDAGAASGAASTHPAGTLTAVARHHELGPTGLALLRRSTPQDATVFLDNGDEPRISANQEVIVPADGVSVDRPAARGPLTPGLNTGRPSML